ncbi:MAG TPA: N-acetyl-gamma-glutamyl-phosphate reductase [Gemmatimonadales bacterium]|nr:N-acetyl-gamma-glutamyl-phosphate reductase [Gemmatimonadales bacterium]
MHKNTATPVAVLGASGYVGRELVALLNEHPDVAVAFTTSQSEPEVLGHRSIPLEAAERRWRDAAVVFSCLPHGVSAPVVERARSAGPRVIDLSSDLRLSERAVYGLTEVARPALPEADVVANPGCYPTAALIALLPFARAGLIDTTRPIIIDAASGVSGAGRSPRRELLFAEVAEDFRAYGIGNVHRHLPEITGHLTPFTGPADIVFTPHLLPVRRGILSTVHVPVREPLEREAGERILLDAYAGEPCIRVIQGGAPSLRDVVYRNRVALGVTPVRHVSRPMLTVVSAIDNLVKGAAGQAIQNMNVMLRFAETRGLLC